MVETPDHALAAADRGRCGARGGRDAEAAGRRADRHEGPVLRPRACRPPRRATSSKASSRPTSRTVSRQAVGGGRGHAGQAQHGPVRHGLVQRDQLFRQRHLALAAQRRRQCRAGAGRLLGRQLGGDRGAARARRRPAPTPAARSASRRPSPASAGIKPTYGRCSRWGMVAFASLARPGRADGARRARLRDHAGGRWPGSIRRIATSLDLPVPNWEAALSERPRRARGSASRGNIAIDGVPSRDRRASGTQGIDWLKDAGAEIVEVSLPHTKYALPTYYIIAPGRSLVQPRPL